jgi:hypothetical protein
MPTFSMTFDISCPPSVGFSLDDGFDRCFVVGLGKESQWKGE